MVEISGLTGSRLGLHFWAFSFLQVRNNKVFFPFLNAGQLGSRVIFNMLLIPLSPESDF